MAKSGVLKSFYISSCMIGVNSHSCDYWLINIHLMAESGLSNSLATDQPLLVSAINDCLFRIIIRLLDALGVPCLHGTPTNHMGPDFTAEILQSLLFSC